MTVTLSEEAALTSTAPQPAVQAAPETAPELGEPAPVPIVQPEPQPRPVPPPPQVTPAAPPTKTAPPVVRAPAPKAPPAKAPPVKAPPAKAPATKAPAAKAPAAKAPASKALTRPAGASRIGDDFLKGVPGAKAAAAPAGQPAAAIGPAVRSALASAISRQLKPRWVAPQGAEAELLVTILTWELNPDGSLAGAPRVVRQDGITDANRAQAARHAEQAIRAVRLAAPFNLPEEYYSGWKRITAFRFDRRLSQ
jgi:outer membrane biosynthesis protein TonB